MIRVLIVEDDPLNIKLFRDLLQIHGYQVEVAMTGAQAEDLVKDSQYDLVLMDIQLPDTSGLQLITRLRQRFQDKNVPIVAVTAYAMAEDRQRILEAGFDDYLAKPVEISELLDLVGRLGGQNGNAV